MSNKEKLSIENAHIMFRNFAGAANNFNREGNRGFSVELSEEDANRLIDAGWNVKILAPREEGDSPIYHLPIKVSYDFYPPQVWLICGNKKVLLSEDNVSTLDLIDIRSADVVVTPYDWSVNGKSGIKAYLSAMYVVQEQDNFSSKYADYETSSSL